MGWNINLSGPFAELTPDGESDFNWAAVYPGKPIKVESVQYIFSAATDILGMRANTVSGVNVFPYSADQAGTAGSTAKRFYGAQFHPVFVNSDLTMFAAANVRIVIQATVDLEKYLA